MAKFVYIAGLDTVLRNLKRSGDKIGLAVQRGLVKGGHLLQKASTDIVPVQLGALKASSFTRNVGGRGFDADVVVGYTSDYAVYVHEDLVGQAPPARAAHGKAFNVKHAEEIAVASGTLRGTAKGGMFPRGERQQAKFLEQSAREKRRDILRVIVDEVRRVK